MSGAMNRHCLFPGLTMSTALTGNFSAGCRNRQTMHTGFKRVHIIHVYQRPEYWRPQEETGRYDFKRGKICVVF